MCFLRRPQKLTKSSPAIWQYVVSVKSPVKISSIFVAFLENINFIQEGFIIKIGLRWHEYSICFESAAFLDKKKNVFRKNFNSLWFATLKKYASVPRSKIRQLTGILFTRIVCITHFSHAFTPWGPYIYAINIYIFIFLKPNNDNSFIIPLWIKQNCTRYQDIFQIHFFFWNQMSILSLLAILSKVACFQNWNSSECFFSFYRYDKVKIWCLFMGTECVGSWL